jgi:hypothetical protein
VRASDKEPSSVQGPPRLPKIAAIQKEAPELPAAAQNFEDTIAADVADDGGGGGGVGSMLGGVGGAAGFGDQESIADALGEEIDDEAAPVPWWQDPEFYKQPKVLAGAAAAVAALLLLRRPARAATPTVIVTSNK